MKPALDGLTCETVSDAAGRRAEASLVPTFEGKELDAKDLPEIQAEIRYIGDMQRLQVKPGDVFVLSVDLDDLSEWTVKHLQEVVRRELGDVKVLVLSKGLTLGVMGMASINIPPEAEVMAGGICFTVDLGLGK